jgi:hypothetical protein
MPGTVYKVPPIPADPEHTTYVDAGVLRIGVEYRLLDDAGLAANYQGEAMEEIQAAVDGKTIEDNGVSIHVEAVEDGHEYLRFDCFENEPHYHYIDASGKSQTIMEFDRVAHGDMITWAIGQLRTRLSVMLEYAGGGEIAARVQPAQVEAALEEAERLARKAEKALAGQKKGTGAGP